ncbi:uncharacterized protein HGUI_02611 [Hanseniaspora guilliermondii]|uniref:HMG box domain-containing protein n=1 Tax=Hanseniaspora guilliermondii TaxID=56406 RepID=A0A1L0B5T6_9ASCO|nr:uncharacterized protein HGUI_02611 [Hanseniaspora guilliermondii]
MDNNNLNENSNKNDSFKANIIRATPDMKVPDVPDAEDIKIPKRLESKNSNGKVRRPRNAFIIFRSHQHKVFVDSFIKDNKPIPHNSEISKMIGAQWKSLNPKERQVWVDAAENEKADHLKKYPDYKYQPVRRKAKKELREKEKVLKKNKLKVYNAIENQNKQIESKVTHEGNDFQYQTSNKADQVEHKEDIINKGFNNLYEMNQPHHPINLKDTNPPVNYMQHATSSTNMAIDRFQMEQYQQLKQIEQLKQMEQIRYLQQQQYMMMQQQMLSQQNQEPTLISNTKNNSNNDIIEQPPIPEYYPRVPPQPYAVVDRRTNEDDHNQMDEGQQPMRNGYMPQQYYMYLQDQQNKKNYMQDVGYEYYYPQNENVQPYGNFVGYQNYQQQDGTPPKQQQQSGQYIQPQYNQFYNGNIQQQGYYYGNDYPQGDMQQL